MMYTDHEKAQIDKADFPNVHAAQTCCNGAMLCAAMAHNKTKEVHKHMKDGDLDAAVAAAAQANIKAGHARSHALEAHNLTRTQAAQENETTSGITIVRIIEAISRRANKAAAEADNSATEAITTAALTGRNGF